MSYNTIYELGQPSTHRIIGALVGQAVGDALGATYEFGPAGAFSKTFPSNDDIEMRGGGSFGWEVGEFTDDTQMAVILAQSIVERADFEPSDVFARWRKWARTARDVGSTTRRALNQPSLHEAREVISDGRGNGTGAVMRVSPVGLMRATDTYVEWVARTQGKITHPDKRTVESGVITALLIKRLISTPNPTDIYAMVHEIISEHVELSMREWAYVYFCPPLAEKGNNFEGHDCLAQALHCVASTDNYIEAVRKAIDMGGDADTVAAVTGAIAGAMYGITGIPARLATKVHGYVPGTTGVQRIGLEDLYALASKVAGRGWRHRSPDYGGVVKPVRLWNHGDVEIYASNLAGAATVDPNEFGVISLCRTFGELDHIPDRVQFYLVDNADPESNPNLPDVVEEIKSEVAKMMDRKKKILIHCHAGVSRTGFVAKLIHMEWFWSTHEEAHADLTAVYPRYQMTNQAFTDYLSREFFATP